MTKGSYQQQVSLGVVGLLDRLHWNSYWGGGLVRYGDGLQIWAHFELKMNGSLNWRRHQKTLVDREFKSPSPHHFFSDARDCYAEDSVT